jgi:hypothetical protein
MTNAETLKAPSTTDSIITINSSDFETIRDEEDSNRLRLHHPRVTPWWQFDYMFA